MGHGLNGDWTMGDGAMGWRLAAVGRDIGKFSKFPQLTPLFHHFLLLTRVLVRLGV